MVSGSGIRAAFLAVLVCAGSATAQPEFDRLATAMAQILAGIRVPAGDPALDRLLRSEAFAEHQKWMVARWNQARTQITAIENWRAQQLNVPNAQARTL